MSTASLEGARDHARAQAGTAVTATSRTIPATAAVTVPSGVDPAAVVWDETVAAGNYASQYLLMGAVLRIADDEGDACVHLVVHNAAAPCERINVADTVKVQWQAFLGAGAVLLSDMGRVLMTIIGDTSARHDALCGTTSAAHASARYGSTGIHAGTPTVRQLLTVAAAKHGLDTRDLPCGVNLFKSVTVGDDGGLHLAGDPAPGTAIELRADMDVLVFVANVPHPLDVRPSYTSSTVRITAWRDGSPRDRSRGSTPERKRAYENTDDYRAGRLGHRGPLGRGGR